MHWMLLTPFLQRKDAPWIHNAVHSAEHEFDVVTAGYAHDRTRKTTSGRDWLDYLWHAVRGAFAALTSGRRRIGFITAFPQLALCIGLIKRVTGVRTPVVAWFFNLGRRYDGRKGRFAAFCLAGVDVFVVYSTREITTYSEMLGLPPERFVFIPFTEELAEAKFTEDLDDPFVVSIGTANRDYRTLFKAIAPLGLRTVVVAPPHAVEGLEVPDCVTVRSGLQLAECHELCQRARLNVVPLDNDETASGQVTVRDAMMFRKAVVATVSIGTEEYVESGVTGILVPPRDPAVLGAAIRELWDDSGKRERLGAAAQAWVLAHAGFDVGPQRMLEILERIRLQDAAA